MADAFSSLDLIQALRKIDLADELNTLTAKTPNFYQLFQRKSPATNTKHEWLEDSLQPKQIAYSAATSDGVFTMANESDAQCFAVGDIVSIKETPALLRVVAVEGATVSTVFVAKNGARFGAGAVPTGAGVLCFNSRPFPEGSKEAPPTLHETGRNHNFTQILRKEVAFTGTAIAVGQYGGENAIAQQLTYSLLEVNRELNRVALFGAREQRTKTANGAVGGLYDFGTQASSKLIDVAELDGSKILTDKIINDAAEMIVADGADPDIILCSPSQRRVLYELMKNQISLQPGDHSRGGYVDTIVNAITGRTMRIVTDYDVPDSDVWVMDSRGFGLCPLSNRWLKTTDISGDDVDGYRTMILGEFTLEFKNAPQRLCRITGLTGSAEALAATA